MGFFPTSKEINGGSLLDRTVICIGQILLLGTVLLILYRVLTGIVSFYQNDKISKRRKAVVSVVALAAMLIIGSLSGKSSANQQADREVRDWQATHEQYDVLGR